MKNIILFCLALLITGVFNIICGQNKNNEAQVSNVFPEHYFKSESFTGVPQIITGENFDPVTSELFIWSPEYSDAAIEKEICNLGKETKTYPASPPEGAVKIEAIDIEEQVIVANINSEFLWIKNKDSKNYSKPYLTKIAKPYWISREEIDTKSTLQVFGEGLNTNRKTRIVLKHESGAIYDQITQFMEVRQTRRLDGRIINFNLPPNIKNGEYTLYLHNGYGGEYGWVKAGHFKVMPEKTEEAIYNVTDYGAIGDGLSNSIDAINKTLTAACVNGGGKVFFPPGTYLIDETLEIPSGVTVLGAGRNNTVIRGIGYNKQVPLNYWWLGNTEMNAAYSVIVMTDNTSIKSITVEGAVSKGSGGYGMIRLMPEHISLTGDAEIENVCIKDCNIDCSLEDKESTNILYRSSIYVGCKTRYFNLSYNQIKGSVVLQLMANRADIIENKFTKGTYLDVVALSGRCMNSFIDSNIFTDFPGRICINSLRHTYYRYNEMRNAAKGTWTNAEETFLLHGGALKSVSLPTAASETTLTDSNKKWEKDQYKDAMVVITKGKGFGQYRRVINNTENKLIIHKPWNVLPNEDSEYVVGNMYTENVFYGNVNNSPTRMSLWLDCLANTVELYRDEFSGGIDIWGQDRAYIDKNGYLKDGHKFWFSYYNMILNSWLDGSSVKIVTGVKSPSVYNGTPLFGNFVANNKIRYPYMNRTGFTHKSEGDYGAGIYLSASSEADKAISSHSIIANNYITYATKGISVPENANKTFLLNNEFNEVRNPINDNGARTICTGNKSEAADQKGRLVANIENYRSKRELIERIDTPYKLKRVIDDKIGIKAIKLRKNLSFYAYHYVNDSEKQNECKENLLEIYKQLVLFQKKEGALPNASFYPSFPFIDDNSLNVILGKPAKHFLNCPSINKDISKRVGLTYIWNSELNGKRLKDIKDPSNIWLIADVAAVHEWMVEKRYAGHSGGVNVLFADGSVRLVMSNELEDTFHFYNK